MHRATTTALDWKYGRHWSAGSARPEPFALELEQLLLGGHYEKVLPLLRGLVAEGPPEERAIAGWVLARWEAEYGTAEGARQAIRAFHANRDHQQVIDHQGPFLLAIQLCTAQGDIATARTILNDALKRFGSNADLALAEFQVLRAEGADTRRLSEVLRRLHCSAGLSKVSLLPGDTSSFDRLIAEHHLSEFFVPHNAPLVSVIVPVYNAALELPTALRGLCAQSWPNLEILLIDDGSTDASRSIACAHAEHDSRIKVHLRDHNEGAYPVRNFGLAKALGEFITVHDADDWSHPQKIELQARALLNNNCRKASVSHWVRTSNDLEMTRSPNEKSWIHRNVSSLMFRTNLRDEIGYWDRLRVNADTEYYYRILHLYGPDAIIEVCPGVPLAFARTLTDSLTNRSETHLRTQVRGVRHDHMEAAKYWHSLASRPDQLYLPERPSTRPFAVPARINMDTPAGAENDFDKLKDSEFFDEDWYLQAYPDVRHSGMGAVRHYLASGADENRDPGPLFSTSGYRLKSELGPQENPLLHFLKRPHDVPELRLPSFAGDIAESEGDALPVLVFAHLSGETLFGAERSLLDVLARLKRTGYSPVVVLPSHHNAEYLARLRQLCAAVETLPQTWRSGVYRQNSKTIAAIRALIQKHDPCEIHVNTAMLDAPLAAARDENVPSVVYVREMPAEDPELCRSVAVSPEVLRKQLLADADRFVVPSTATAKWLACPARITVRPNAVDESLFDLPFEPGRFLNIGLISSNIAKKGIGDFVAAADLVARLGAAVRFLLIGPNTVDIEGLRPFPPNVRLCGYAASPLAAVAQADVVVSLSQFAESFGRTVVEAMAAGRPVICYDRGAPPSLVVSGTTGLVVPQDSVIAVAEAVLALDADRDLLGRFSEAARRQARQIQAKALT